MRLAEIAEALARHGNMRANVSVEPTEGDALVFEIRAAGDVGQTTELYEELRRVKDLAQIQSFAERYGVPPENLVAFLLGEREQ